MNKPLSDCTLSEVKRICKGKSCSGCPFHDAESDWYFCIFERLPYDWDIPDQLKETQFNEAK